MDKLKKDFKIKKCTSVRIRVQVSGYLDNNFHKLKNHQEKNYVWALAVVDDWYRFYFPNIYQLSSIYYY